MAGILKVLAALRHDGLPASLHSQPLNPHIPWDDLEVDVVDTLRPWPQGERVRRAGVSSFGLSGTNAHVILEEAPSEEPSKPALASSAAPLVLSGRDEAALRAQAERWAEWLEQNPDAHFADVVSTAARQRTHFTQRAALTVSDLASAAAGLRALSTGAGYAGLITGESRSNAKLAVLFTGQGSQRAGMGKELYASEPLFRAKLEETVAALEAHLSQPLLGIMFGDSGSAEGQLLHETEYTQPALFALEVALYRLWSRAGFGRRRLRDTRSVS